MPKMDRRNNRLPSKAITIKSQLRKAKTIDDLLTQDDVSATLAKVNGLKSDITEIIIIYKKLDGCVAYDCPDYDVTKALGLIEFAKDVILHPENNEGD